MKRKYILPGVILIFAGLYFFIASLPGISLPNGLFFIAIGAAMLVSRLFSHKRYGLTIAGFILFWLGAGRLLLDVLHIGAQYGLVAVPLALALSFFLTHIFEYRRLGNWPMIPALILLGFAVVFFLILTPAVNAILQPYYGAILPLLLIVLGIIILVRGGKRSKKAAAQHIEAEFEHKADEDIPSPDQWAQPPVEPAAEPDEEPVTVEPIIAEPIVEEPVTVIPEAEIPTAEPVEEPAAVDMEAEFEAVAPVLEAEEPEVIPVEPAVPEVEPEELPEEEKKPEATAE